MTEQISQRRGLVLDSASESARSLWADAALAVATNGIALYGFDTVFSGADYMVAGLIGVFTAVLTGAIADRLRWRWWNAVTLALGVFVIVGPVAALRPEAFLGVFPSPSALRALVDGAIRGWWRLLTTVPRVGQQQHLLVVPYLSGFVAALATILARRTRRFATAAIAAPFALLGVTALVGTHQPSSLLIEAGVLTAVALGWASAIEQRRRPVVGGTTRHRGLVGSAVMVAAVALLAGTIGPALPGVAHAKRVVVRDRIEPPFDPSQYPSPLAGFRNFHQPKIAAGDKAPSPQSTKSLQDKVLFTVSGLDKDVPLRIAVMDSYDGHVYRATTGDDRSTYRTIGDQIPLQNSGSSFRATVRIGALTGVWLPTIGDTSTVGFNGKRAQELRESFRYNLAMSAGVVVAGLKSSDSYEVSGIVTAAPTIEAMCRASVAGSASPLPSDIQDYFGSSAFAADYAAAKTNCGDAVRLALTLKNSMRLGYLDNGGQPNSVGPGHSFGRLAEFLNVQTDEQSLSLVVGNGEQSAAAMATVLRAKGFPARVVLGVFAKPGTKDYKGSDVRAWVELPMGDLGWVRFDPTPENTDPPPPRTNPKPVESKSDQPPPPPIVPPRTNNGNDDATVDGVPSKARKSVTVSPEKGFDFGLLIAILKITLLPLTIIGTPMAFVWWLKFRRRKRRRGAATPALQIAGGWHEATDLLRDLGRPVPQLATRRELASLHALPELEKLANIVDLHMFGGTEPDPGAASFVWDQLETTRGTLLGGVGPFRRFKTSLSLTSLRFGK